MRHLAVVVAAALVFAMIAPAFAQPFADVPTNHWAYDAIAELAAKGLIEGYPDGTFKGDRAMTRYEMAMVVARILARIESIQIPAPAKPMAPDVTKADLAALQRLVNEFRAELAALGVRVTAIEEELNAIKARLDNVRITGRYRVRYDGGPSCSGASLNGNSATCATAAINGFTTFRARQGLKLMMDGSVTPDVHAIIGLEDAATVTSTPSTFNSSNFGNAAGTAATPVYVLANIAELYFDYKNAWGWPIEIRVGRMGGGQQGFGSLPLQFGPFGLLLNTGSDTYGASTNNVGTHLIDGFRLDGHWDALADLNLTAALWRVQGPTGGSSYFLGEDAYGADANVRIFPGLRVGGYLVGNTINAASTVTAGALNAFYHVYGNPSTASTNPTTTNCPASGAGASQAGITCAAQGNGYGGYVNWDVFPGIHFDGEVASWTDATRGSSDTAFQASVLWDLGTLLGVGHKLSLQTDYGYFGTNFYAPYGVEVDTNISGTIFPGNGQGFTGQLSFEPVSGFSVYGLYFTGNNVSNGMTVTEYRVGVRFGVTPASTLNVYAENQAINSISQYNLYRAEFNYTF